MGFKFGLVILIVLIGLVYFIHQEYTRFIWENKQREAEEVNEFAEYGSDESEEINLLEGLEKSMENLNEAINDFCEKEDICKTTPIVKDYAFFIISPQAMVEYVETDEGVETNYQVYDGKDVNGNDTFRYATYFSSDSFESHLKQASDNRYERLA